MRKLISVLSALMLTSTAAINTISCEAPTDAMKILVGGKEKFEFDWRDEKKEISAIDLFANDKNKLLSNLTIQILEAFTYTDSKYQNIEKRIKEQKFLGKEGLGLSLDYILNDSYTDKKAKVSFEDDSVKDNFIEDFTKSTKNTRFKTIDYNIKDISLDKTKLSGKFGNNSENKDKEVTTFNGENSFGVPVVKEFNDKGDLEKTSELKKDNSPFGQTRKSNLLDYYNMKWEEFYPDLFANDKFGSFKDYKDKSVFAMESADAENFYDILAKNATIESKKLLAGVNKNTFALLHKQLNGKGDKLEIGFLMPSDFLMTESIEGSSLSDYKDTPYDISKGSKIFKENEKEEIQAQDTKNNENKTFVYAKSDLAPSIKLNFSVPINDEKEKSYDVNITGLNNVIVGMSLASFKISEVKDESSDKKRTDVVYYWYEPTIYQFSKDKFFKIGTENMFSALDVEKVNIKISNSKE
ncbi:hypothetical protein SLITO_v1c00250 [Spiroplasma litorale]|uniref:Lipoprotein n=1 Tax=Spiroplasma litorale TaxID=216942 RepID=A0A0K1W0I5_9MOLU|nr:hypothetical protein [Spiroplasma litorale]AKX33693.1 hypothetical protein SLITO_v1c00250 [Spiroplasma litorale]